MEEALSQGKKPPQNIEAERSVLGGVLIDNGVLDQVLDILQAEDFYREAHRKIFAAMCELARRGEAVDLITLGDLLRAHGELESVGGAVYLASLPDAVLGIGNISEHARLVRDKAIARRLLEAAHQIMQAGLEDREDVGTYLDEAEKLIFQVGQRRSAGSVVPLKDILRESFDQIDRIYNPKEGERLNRIPTGFKKLDDLTAGFQRSDLIIIAARPSMGKTSLALNIAHNAASRFGVPVLIFSLEMSRHALGMRLLCMEARVDFHRILSGHLTESDWPRLARAAGQLSEELIFIDDTPAIRVMEMRAKARRLQAELRRQGKDLGLIMMDYLQLATASTRSDSREREISEISRSLKALAKEMDVPLVALSQLSRKPEARELKKPQMSDLRESGAIEQDADLIIFIYRDEVYNKDSPDKGIAEIDVAKQRNGPTGVIRLQFSSDITRFENLELDRDF